MEPVNYLRLQNVFLYYDKFRLKGTKIYEYLPKLPKNDRAHAIVVSFKLYNFGAATINFRQLDPAS